MSSTSNPHAHPKSAARPPQSAVDRPKPSGDDLPKAPKWKAYAVVLALIAIVLALVGTMAVLSTRDGDPGAWEPTTPAVAE